MDDHSPEQSPLAQIRGLFDTLATIKDDEGQPFFQIARKMYRGPNANSIQWFAVKAYKDDFEDDKGVVKVRVNAADSHAPVYMNSPTAECDNLSDTLRLVTCWARTVVPDTHKDRIPALPTIPITDSVRPTEDYITQLLAEARQSTPAPSA